MIDLEYDSASLCGPVDFRVVRFLEKYRWHPIDPSYLAHAREWHGGVPGKQYFTAGDGKPDRVGRFLTLVDDKTELEPPRRSSWQNPERDVRIDWSVLALIDQEGPSCRNLFAGERLIPFAALYRGLHHPDGMSLTEGETNLLCFFYAPERSRPQVVIWLAHEAQEEYRRWEGACRATNWNEDEPVRYESCTVSVAPDFDAFLALLRAEL